MAHISNVYGVLSGRWTYEDSGLLDRTHFRFFTKYEIIKLFEEADLIIDEMRSKKLPIEEDWKRFREEILSLCSVHVDPEDLDTFQWLVRVQRE